MILLSSAPTSTLNSDLLEVNDNVNFDVATDNLEVEEGLSTEDEDEEADEVVLVGTTSKDTIWLLFSKARMITNGKQGMQQTGGDAPLKKTI